MSSGRPQVSVVLPTRNRRALLERALDCALGQCGVSLEVIAVDDASEDGTLEYLRSLNDPRVSVLRRDSQTGPAGARNAGVSVASAPWLAFLDDDDFWAPRKLARQIEALERDAEAGWSCTGTVIVDRNLELIGRYEAPMQDDLSEDLLRYNIIPGGCSGTVARRLLVQQVGGFDPALGVLADWDLWIRLAQSSKHIGVNEPLLAYARHQSNMTRDLSRVRDEVAYVERKYAAERSTRGIGLDQERWLDWIADTLRRAGFRRRPALIWAGIGLRTRSFRPLIRAAVAAAYPGWVEVRDRQRTQRIEPAWPREAEAWLLPLRAREKATCGISPRRLGREQPSSTRTALQRDSEDPKSGSGTR